MALPSDGIRHVMPLHVRLLLVHKYEPLSVRCPLTPVRGSPHVPRQDEKRRRIPFSSRHSSLTVSPVATLSSSCAQAEVDHSLPILAVPWAPIRSQASRSRSTGKRLACQRKVKRSHSRSAVAVDRKMDACQMQSIFKCTLCLSTGIWSLASCIEPSI